MSRPVVFTISPQRPFVDALAGVLLQQAGGDPLALADRLILLPTRRACRALREAFLRRADGAALLLPRMQPIGDVDEDALVLAEAGDAGPDAADLPPAVSDLGRRALLGRLVQAMPQGGERPGPEQAILLAGELARLLDEVHARDVDWNRLDGLVPQDYAENWQQTLRFLDIVRRRWPEVLAEIGCLDPIDRRNRQLRLQAERWRTAPPTLPVIAAGSTGSMPATAELLAVVAQMPQGAVVLPGLDRRLDETDWEIVRREETHPQHGMALLLDRLGLDRSEVQDWPDAGDGAGAVAGEARIVLLSEAMRPAETSEKWRDLPETGAEATRGVARIDLPTAQAEAGAIALILREALETPGRQAALVTPDRTLARRVAAELRRWGIDIDDSAGRPLAETPPCVFLRLLAEAAAADLAPVPLLALLKHPLAAAGMPAGRLRAEVRLLERTVLRGPRPEAGIDGLLAAVSAAAERARNPEEAGERAARLGALLDRLERCLAPLACIGRESPFAEALDAHVAAAEALAADDETAGPARLWQGDDGEALARFVAEALDAGDVMPPIRPGDFPGLLEAMLTGRVVRPGFGRHPRLHIWGLLEARLQHADLVVLGGLNEGTWPPEASADPWMSRPMRRDFGLPPPERRIGLTAHDFAQAFSAPEVVLTRAEKVDGQPTVPSRWLSRLAVLTGGDPAAFSAQRPWRGWWEQLGRIAGPARPVARPEPRPPVARRPRRLSVTQIETWMRDPYGVFARHVLGLEPLDPIDASPGAADRGSVIHEALDRFMAECGGALPPDAEERLLAIGRESFGPALARPTVQAFWWPRFERVAHWFVQMERARREQVSESFTEIRGSMTLEAPAGGFEVRAKADRIDRLTGGGYAILDYKTGGVPSRREVEAGFAPQLPLEAAILAAGGFGGVPAGPAVELAYWRLSGGDPPGEVSGFAKLDIEAAAAQARDGVARLAALFDDPDTPYRALPRPRFAGRFNDYAHLARLGEWLLTDGDEG